MPIPSPNRFKDKDSFIQACMEVEIGSGKPQDQAFAICNASWENRNMNKSYQQKVLSKVNRINLLDPNPCTTGYIAYGTKIKDGREVPNCIPID
jgi:hypothetical protein